MFSYEQSFLNQGLSLIAGVDEAGRGPLAGPVVAAACILPQGMDTQEIDDSKKLSASKREVLSLELLKNPKVLFGIGQASVEEIDRYNILQATFLAMQRAVLSLPLAPDHILVDGNRSPCFYHHKQSIPYTTIIEGDAKSKSIAAASILAKVYRDHLMQLYAIAYPQYQFEKHKGYGTEKHREALAIWNQSPIHRKSFIKAL